MPYPRVSIHFDSPSIVLDFAVWRLFEGDRASFPILELISYSKDTRWRESIITIPE